MIASLVLLLPNRLVQKAPGSTISTLMQRRPTSSASASDMPSSANLVALYRREPGEGEPAAHAAQLHARPGAASAFVIVQVTRGSGGGAPKAPAQPSPQIRSPFGVAHGRWPCVRMTSCPFPRLI